ncbi:MAG: NAD-binding protein [Halioglobus sp.]
MQPSAYRSSSTSWRIAGAVFFFLSAIVGFEMGVSVSERPEILESSLLEKAYYSLGLFVLGGMDLGTPEGGPLIGRILLWLSYFGSPILAASTVVSALLKALNPQGWFLRRLRKHVIVVGDGDIALTTIRTIRNHNKKIPIVVISNSGDQVMLEELRQNFGAIVVSGDITHEFFLEQLHVSEASKIFLLENNSLRNYEAASTLLDRLPMIGEKIVIHCSNLRFMRSMANSPVAQRCEIFNTYHLAASGLVRSYMLQQFHETASKDIVVLAGFGRFGQTILEEMQRSALSELETVAIIDIDAHRRVLVADEQMEFSGLYHRELFEGDIAHPEVWERLDKTIDISGENTAFVLGTGREDENLRLGLWLRKKYPGAMVVTRTSQESLFAREMGEEQNIVNVSITELVENHLPSSWVRL